MIEQTSFRVLTDRIEPLLGSWHDYLLPEEIEAHPGNRYRPTYAWMFTYERQLRDRVEAALSWRLGGQEKQIFGPDGVFSEALSNAFVHGHRRDPSRPIEVRSAVGRAGMVFEISDSGDGFDVQAMVARLVDGGTYFHQAGNGVRVLNSDHNVVAGWTDGGRKVAILVRLTR